MSSSFEVTDRNRVRRVARRGEYDRETVYRVIDAAWLGHVGFADPEHGLTVIPMLHARINDCLLFHGATTSRLMSCLASGRPVCVSFCLVDGLVLAKSLFHHSMNYRSAVAFGSGSLVQSADERMAALQAISDKLMPGRWEDARLPSDKEMKATAIVQVQIESASAKIRAGGPIDDVPDQQLDHWSGVVPINSGFADPVADEFSQQIPLPGYLSAMQTPDEKS